MSFKDIRMSPGNKGLSLLEVVLYVGLFSMLSVVAINSMMQTVSAFNHLRSSRDMNDSAVKVMERLTRDVKSATLVDLTNSTFNADPGRLTLSTVNASGTAMTVEYYVSGNTLRIRENGTDKGSLISSRTEIEGLVFNYIDTGETAGVKINLRLRPSRGVAIDENYFYNTIILRGTY